MDSLITGDESMNGRTGDNPAPHHRVRTAAKVTGVTSCALLSLLMNPLFVAPVIALTALLFGPARDRSPQDSDGAAVER